MQNLDLTRRQFLGATATAIGLAAVTGCATPATILNPGTDTPAGVARLKISRPSKFKILQLTDVHMYSGPAESRPMLNERTAENLKRLVALAEPDLVMVTGDLWRDNPPERLEEFMHYGVGKCAELGVPWAFAWGNHDQLNDYAVGHKALTEARNSLYRGSDSEGNYVVDVIGHRGKCVCQLLCINTKQEGAGASQQQWLRSLGQKPGKPVPRFAFFHIPLKQYADVWANGAATGVKVEAPCIEKEDGSTLPILKSLGVKACFCGHDHINDYGGVCDGVDLVYGRATGIGGYGAGDVPKGGKLITVNCKTGRYEWVSILPDGTRWQPKPGEHIEKERVK